MVIYADELFFINMLANELLMYSYCVICKIKPQHGKMAAAAGGCAVYAVAEAVLRLPGFFRLALLPCMVYAGFGKQGIVRHTSRLMLMCFALEGVVMTALAAGGASAELAGGCVTVFTSEPFGAAVYIFAYPVLWTLSRLYNRERQCRHLYIEYDNKTTEFDVLYDSGNLLRYRNKPVIMAAWEAAAPLFEFDRYAELNDNADSFVIYETISGAGVVPVINPQRCVLEGSDIDAAVAVVEKRFKGKYCGVVGNI